jgi:hypothetical protein
MRRTLLLALLLAGCSKGPEADLPAIGEARSLAAEWALVNDQAGKGRLTSTYVDTMHQAVRDQLATTQSTLTDPGSDYASEITALLALPADAPPARLRTHVDRLKQIEDHLESA